jgi:hypothetical protein
VFYQQQQRSDHRRPQSRANRSAAPPAPSAGASVLPLAYKSELSEVEVARLVAFLETDAARR